MVYVDATPAVITDISVDNVAVNDTVTTDAAVTADVTMSLQCYCITILSVTR